MIIRKAWGGALMYPRGASICPPSPPLLKKKQPGLLLNMHMGEVGEWGWAITKWGYAITLISQSASLSVTLSQIYSISSVKHLQLLPISRLLPPISFKFAHGLSYWWCIASRLCIMHAPRCVCVISIPWTSQQKCLSDFSTSCHHVCVYL